jgi:FixJ family two-component response regulator
MTRSRISPAPADEPIFLIEADQVVRSALNFILDHDNEIHAFPSLEEAITRVDEVNPGIVVLGIGIVQSHGERVLADLSEKLGSCKILLVADSTADPLAQASLRQGAHDIITKPITFDGVRGKLDAALASLRGL